MKKLFCLFLLAGFCSVTHAQKINTTLAYLVKEPEKKSNKTPVLVMMHGYGSNESDLFELAQVLDKKFIVFSLRAPESIGRDGFAWYKMDFLPDQKFRYYYADAQKSRQKVLSFISNACSAYNVDSNNVYLLGFSQGAILSYDIAFFAPSKIKGVMALSGRMLDETKAWKSDLQALSKVRFFIAHGNTDNIIKLSDAQNANEYLKTKNITDISYHEYPAAHTITAAELEDIKSWLSGLAGTKKGTSPKNK